MKKWMMGFSAAVSAVMVSCATAQRPAVEGVVGGRAVYTALDSPRAEGALRDLTEGRVRDGVLAQALAADGVPTYEELRDLAQNTSPDAATLVLMERIGRDPRHAETQGLYDAYLDRLRQWTRAGLPLIAACLKDSTLPELHFVPGWFYERNPTTGADFAAQRRLFEVLGIHAELITVGENAAVEDNAKLIAAHIARINPDRRVILVSTSKGGPETAHALGALLSPPDSLRVRAWVNIGGVLRGSPLADLARTWPLSWLAWAMLAWDGVDGRDSVPSLTSKRSAARHAIERMPPHLAVFNYVGVPFSGQITAAARDGYDRLRRFGPNDGLTPLAHQWSHGGKIVLGVGLDHFYRAADIDLMTAAMAFTVFEALGEATPRNCVRP